MLIGLRASLKEDINRSAAEMVYGKTMKIPGEYFMSEDTIECPEMFVQKLKERMRQVRPLPATNHSRETVFIHGELENCSHVFVRIDRIRRSLEQSYEGPCKIIEGLSGYLYKIDYKGQPTNINIDRLKPAFLETEEILQEIEVLKDLGNTPQSQQIPANKEEKKKKVQFRTR